MKANHKTFPGGYVFKNFEGMPTNKVVEFKIPQTVTIPLKQGFGEEVLAVVKPGEKVKAGQTIGIINDTICSPILSSVNGTVEEIKKINLDNSEVNAVIIKSDETTDYKTLDGYSTDWSKLSSNQIQELIYKAGVSSLDRSGIPTKFNSSVISPNEVEDVVVNGINTQPFNPSLEVLLKGERKSQLIEGMKILKAIMPNAKLHLALDKNDDKLIEEFSKEEWLTVHPLTAKYPQGFDEVIVPTILGKKFPYGYSAANIGALVLNIDTVLHAYDAVALGKPLVERTIALAGPSWKENVHLKVRIGTSIEDIMKEFIKDESEKRIVVNNILTNEAISSYSIPVEKTTSVLVAIPENREREVLAFVRGGKNRDSITRSFLSSLIPNISKRVETNLHGDERPCISCGFCDEVCPKNLIPHLLHKHVERNILDERVINYRIFDCIDCNLCSYVCTSKINVSKLIREGKEKLAEEGYNKDDYVLNDIDFKGSK